MDAALISAARGRGSTGSGTEGDGALGDDGIKEPFDPVYNGGTPSLTKRASSGDHGIGSRDHGGGGGVKASTRRSLDDLQEEHVYTRVKVIRVWAIDLTNESFSAEIEIQARWLAVSQDPTDKNIAEGLLGFNVDWRPYVSRFQRVGVQ